MAKEPKNNTGEEELEFEEVGGQAPEEIGDRILNAQDYFAKHQNVLFGILIGVAVVVGGIWYFFNQRQEAKMQAQTELILPTFDYEKDSLDRALNGSPNGMGFLQIIDNYGSTPAGELAKFYAGSIYMKKGEFQKAIGFLEGYSSRDALLSSRAEALIGDAYMEMGQFEKAINAYQEATEIKPNKFYTPVYLLKLGIAQETAGHLEEAVKAYQRIIDEYPKSSQKRQAERHKSLALGIIGNPEGNKIVDYYRSGAEDQPAEEEATPETDPMQSPQQPTMQVQPQNQEGEPITIPGE